MNKLIKIITLTLLTCILTPKVDARNGWSAGSRTGITLRHLNLTTEYDFKAYNRKWQNQIYITKTIGKRFELELNLNYSQKTITGEYTFNGNIIGYEEKEIALSPGFTARYFVFQCKKYSFYGQLGQEFIQPRFQSKVILSQMANVHPYKSDTEYSPSALLAGIGINYSILKRLYLSAQINVKVKSKMNFIGGEDRETVWASNALVGIGYKF